ncbi:hypothetical protein, partial [Planktothrix sp.]|uniref:hypothetical protein n=1 Tax=Planktothrix sp. TaxID=3088171 RepID=UPI0038D46A31
MNEYIDLYLKFNSENQANSVLFNTQIFGNETIKIPKYTAIDVVGIIYKPSGTLKLEDNSAFDSGIGPSIIFYKKRDANGNQSVAAGITAIGVASSEKLQFYVGSVANLGLPK